MLYFLDPSYSEDDSLTMLRYLGSGDGPRYCGEKKSDDEFSEMLKFEEGRMCDFIYIKPGVMACSVKVKEAIFDEVKNEVQFISIKVDGVELFVVNVINVLDALNYDESVIKCLPDGRVMKISPCVIDEGKVFGSLFFKIPENSCKAFFGTEKLKELVESKGFEGLRFIPLPATI